MADPYSLFVSTFNCGKLLPADDPAAIQAVISALLPVGKPHDVYVLGFQELTVIWQGSFADIVQQTLQKVARYVLEHLNAQNIGRRYEIAALNSSGAIGILALVATELSVLSIFKTNAKCGMLYSSLKGAAALQLTLQRAGSALSDSFVFVTAHLTANEGEEQRLKREEDYHTVVAALQRDFGSFVNHHVFICGDFNFRAQKWALNADDFRNPLLVRRAAIEHDELNLSRAAGRIFHNFEEPPVEFAPTYKFMLTSPDEQYNTIRIPSWCDRVLFRRYHSTPHILSYKSRKRCAALQFTDHLPVSLEVIVPHLEFEQAVSAQNWSESPQWSAELIGSATDTLIGYSGLASDRYGRQLTFAALMMVLWVLYQLFT
ncbi:LAME_0F05798g1_1 [Lachancea meyersii CBS 8951]|uniref:LAME_0F05798g1_1 n=1 Tax=Lachancea meyersii CBS 8951 TaxID=1266667 RepID=A0A1G4JT25_9SACH|nr:LAME_0F05798g1_1 [Lachancea meyersii CBS 8951]